MRKAALFITLLLCACGPSGTSPPEKKDETNPKPGISLSSEEIKSGGIATVSAREGSFRRRIIGYGLVVSIDALAQADADTKAAAATARQSEAAAHRAKSLGSGEEAAVSQEVVEIAQSKAASDRAALLLAQRKAQAVFGVNAPFHSAEAMTGLIDKLATGRSVLVKITFPIGGDSNTDPGGMEISRIGDPQSSWTTSRFWEAPADPALPGASFYAVVDGSGLSQNERVTAARFEGKAQSGVLIPAAAIVMGDGASWVYMQDTPGHFVRTPLNTDRPVGDDYFVTKASGIAIGQRVVVAGSGLLLSRETNPGAGAGE